MNVLRSRLAFVICLSVCLPCLAAKSRRAETSSNSIRVDEGKQPSRQKKPYQSPPIESGFLLVDGQYVSPPYVVAQEGDHILVNGYVIATDALPKMEEALFGSSRRPVDTASVARRLKEVLLEEGVIYLQRGEYCILLPRDDAMLSFSILFSQDDDEDKVQALLKYGAHWVDESEWRTTVASFQPEEEVEQRWLALDPFPFDPDGVYAGKELRGSVIYFLTVASMALSVFGFGTLLRNNPEGDMRWSEINATDAAMKIVGRCVTLVFILSSLDLVLTLVAEKGGTFWELNPLGEGMVKNPAVLACFKLSVTLGSCGILFALRRYRGAQVASWWLCLLCTILTFRWVTFNSMFMS